MSFIEPVFIAGFGDRKMSALGNSLLLNESMEDGLLLFVLFWSYANKPVCCLLVTIRSSLLIISYIFLGFNVVSCDEQKKISLYQLVQSESCYAVLIYFKG